jgi:hypothetical protein
MSVRRLVLASSLGFAAALVAGCGSSSGGGDTAHDAGPSTQDDAGGATPEGGGLAGGRTLEVEATTQASVSAATVAKLAGGAQGDLVTVGDDGSGPEVTVWSWSNGALQKSASYPAAPSPLALASVDVAGSGSPDVLLGVKTGSGGAVMVYPDSNGSLGNATAEPVAGADFLATGDLDEDGHADVVALSATSGIVTVLLGKGDGSLTPSTAWTFGAKTSSPPTSATLVDFDGDGHLDLVTQVASTSSLLVLYGTGAGVFASTGVIGVDGSASIQAFAQTSALGSSGGTTSASAQAPAGPTLVSGKFAPAGEAGVIFSSSGDLYATSDVNGRYMPALSEGLGQSPLVSIAFASGPTDVAAVQTTGSSSVVNVLGETIYGPLEVLATAPLPSAFTGGVAGDFDGDGNQDLALTSASSIVILLNEPGA